MHKKNKSHTAPLKQRKHGWRHLLRERTWATLNIIVGVSMLANTSSLAFLAPKAALALSVDTYDQCSNDTGNGYGAPDTGCRWVPGNLQANNSLYAEGDATVQRLWKNDFVPGSNHTITIEYGTTKSGKHAYDYLTSWDWSENWIDAADLCQDINGCGAASQHTFPIPHDANGSGQFETAGRNFLMRGGQITNVTAPTIVSGSYAGDSDTSMTISFTVDSTGSMCDNGECGIALIFGAHIAKTSQWQPYNGTTGATSIPGSPYHVKLAAIDGDASGQRDNQMQAGAIANVVIEKQTLPDGSSQSFGFTSQTGALNGKTLSDGQQFIAALNAGTYSVTESTTPGWSLSGITCVDPSGGSSGDINTRTATIGVVTGETVTCTFTNSQAATLTVTKVVNNNNGGTATENSFPLFVNQTSVTSGQSKVFAPGAYTVSETQQPGYTQTSITGDCDTNGNVSLAYGDAKSCTITNSDIAPTLKLVKNLTTDNGGSSTLADWTLSATGTGGFSYTADQSSFQTVKANTAYTLGESGPAGYQAGSWSCNGGNLVGNQVTLGLDTDVTCQIANNDLAPTLKLVKNVSGGTNVASEWTMTATGTGGFSDAGNSVTFHEVMANTAYTLSESGPTGYSAGSWSCNGGNLVGNQVTLGLDTDVTCQITNTRDQGTIELQKVWEVLPGTTTLKIGTTVGGNEVDFENLVGVDGTTDSNIVDTGTYYVSEDPTGLTDYSTALVCTDNGQPTQVNQQTGAVIVGKDSNVVCVFTNTRQEGTVTVHKLVDTDADGTFDSGNSVANGLGFAWGLDSEVPGRAMGSSETLVTGNYTVSENSVAGYHFVGWTYGAPNVEYDVCGDIGNQLPVDITIGYGRTTDVTFCNARDSGSITVVKNVDENGDGDTIDAGDVVGSTDWTWDILGGAQNTATGLGQKVLGGTYTISEDQKTGYHVTGLACTDNRQALAVAVGESVNVTVNNGSNIVCTFTNTKNVTTITLDKTGSATATPGQTFTYSLTWGVQGNSAATNAIITDPLPANTTFVSATNGGTFAAGVVTWNLGTKAPGSTGTVNVTVLVNPALTASTTLNNTGTFDTDQTSPVSDSVPTTVTVPQVLGFSAELDLTKSVDRSSANPGDTLTYTLVVTNDGLGEATNVVVTDNLPDGFVFLATNKATRTWNLGTLAAGESKTLTYKVVVGNSVPAGDHVNRAFVTADFFDPIMAEALVTIKIPQVLGLADTGAGLMDYLTFILGLVLVATGAISFMKLRSRGLAST